MNFAADVPYRHKIKTNDEIREAIGPRPREKKVIMCHGTFDIVHPGHLRHLMFSKQHADILIASITCDSHILKANFRPYVPEDLRALNLAAFEMVDYVVIDRNPTPLENLRRIEPDFFAKGFEYNALGLHPKTAEEVAVLESYGGEILFTPGDVVYSSSAIIETAPPDISVEALLILMTANGVSFDDLREALKSVHGMRAHVVGDTIVDTITQTTLIGGMAKTPTFSVRYENSTNFVGGAAIVAKHLRAAGAEVRFSTVLGDDELKDYVLDDLDQAGVEVHVSIDESRPTTNKNAVVAGGYRLLKIDTLDNRSISQGILDQIIGDIGKGEKDVLVFSDFRHGIFNRDTIPPLIAAIPGGVFRVADSQVATRWGNILEYKGFDLITPNEREARFALGDQDSVVRPLASMLYDKAECKTLMLKLGDRGLLTQHCHMGRSERFFYVLNSFTRNVVDAVGAGDALLAYASLVLKATGSDFMASVLGSMAGAIECERDGNIPVYPEEVEQKIADIENRAGHA